MQDTEEIWKDIPGYEGFYQASSLGRIKRIATKVNHSSGVSLSSKRERILKLSQGKLGYMSVMLCKNNVRVSYMAYVLIATAFHHKPNGKVAVNHINCIKTDNRACNLEWVTYSGNRIHAIMNGLIKTIPPDKLLTQSKINTLLNLKRMGYNQMDLARIFKVDQSCISRALNGKRRYRFILK